jgi:cell fate regulator YaaT (PSP1 superfamily)
MSAEPTEREIEFAYGDEFEYESLLESLPEASGFPTYTVHVRFPHMNRVAVYDAGDSFVRRGDKVVVETERGLSLATVVTDRTCRRGGPDLFRVVRTATAEDLRQEERNHRREEEAFRYCWQRIRDRGMPMKLIRVEYLHGGNKAVFYFSADGRIDFRELVKDLAYRLHTRVEMRQIGVRDASKMVGGVGICGRELCCSSWLQKFEPVTIRMAKVQNLSLNPQKVSGVCGRLMCCLAYEQETYLSLRKRIPRVGKHVLTPRGEGRITEIDILAQTARVTFEDHSVVEFEAGQLQAVGGLGDDREIEETPPELRALEDGVEGEGRARLPVEGREVRPVARGGRRKPWQDGRLQHDGKSPDADPRPRPPRDWRPGGGGKPPTT